MFFFGCIQRECQTSKDIVDNYTKYVWIQNLCWSYSKATLLWKTCRKHFLIVPWHGSSCKEMCGTILRAGAILARILWIITKVCSNQGFLLGLWNNTRNKCHRETQRRYHLFMVPCRGRSCKELCGKMLRTGEQNNSTPCIDDHQLKEEERESVGELSKVCSQIVLKCLYVGRICRPDIHGPWTNLHVLSPNGPELATNVWHVWTLTFITRVMSNNIVMSQQCRLGLFQDSDFAGDLADSKSTSGRLFVHICKSYICSHKLDVQEKNSLTQFNRTWDYLSLDAGLRMDGIPALDLWDLVIDVLHSSSNRTRKSKEKVQTCCVANHRENTPTPKSKLKFGTTILSYPMSIMFLKTWSTFLKIMKRWFRWSSRAEVQHWDTCQEPTELLLTGCLTESIWNQKIQIKYVDTKHQNANILTKGNFTRDAWNNLLHLFNISHSSLICCAQNFSSISCLETMAKGMQEKKGEEQFFLARSKPTLHLSSHAAKSSSTVQSPIASKKSGGIQGTVSERFDSSRKYRRHVARERNQDAASSSQV